MSHQLHSESPRALGPQIRLIVESHPHSGPIIRPNGSLSHCFKLWKGSLKQSFENELWLENDSVPRDFFVTLLCFYGLANVSMWLVISQFGNCPLKVSHAFSIFCVIGGRTD